MSQDLWRDKQFRDFLKDYYKDKLTLANAILYHSGFASNPILFARIFDKIASPAYVLSEAFTRWKVEKKVLLNAGLQ